MKIKIEIRSVAGMLLFEFEKEDNTLKDTLIEAVKQDANLRGANLRGANLQGANLRGANLRGAKGKELDDHKKSFWIIPEQGSFIAWKKCKNAIAMIEIPNEAKRTSNIKNRKCRAEFIRVIGMWDLEGNQILKAFGMRDSNLIYETGAIVKPDSYDDDFKEDCSHGIHFFVTKQEAIEYGNVKL